MGFGSGPGPKRHTRVGIVVSLIDLNGSDGRRYICCDMSG